MTDLVVDPSWRMQLHPQGVVVYAGADLSFLIPDVSTSDAAVLADLFEPTTDGEPYRLAPNALPAGVRRLLPQLRSVGAVRIQGIVRADPQLGIRIVGEPDKQFQDFLAERLLLTDEPELLLVLRTSGNLRDLMAVARDLAERRTPYLFVDAAYHHSLGLGPFVVPGATACVGCLAGRVGQRWGDPIPPARPGALADPALPAALIEHAVTRIGRGSLALLDRVVTYHLDELTTNSEDVLPSADCPACPSRTVGRITLPWEGK